jgi:uncharacterized protein (DUF433 family)
MDWQSRIELKDDVLAGKPVIKGTRLAVEFVVDLLSQGWNEQDILDNYPTIRAEDIRACLAYAANVLKAEKVYPLGV